MIRVQTDQKKNSKEADTEAIEKVLTEVTDVDIYSTIKRWEALYPHTYGDQLLEELLSEGE